MLNYRVLARFGGHFGGPWLVSGPQGPVRAFFLALLKAPKKRPKRGRKGPFLASFWGPGPGHWPHYGFGAWARRAHARKTPKIGPFWAPGEARSGRVWAFGPVWAAGGRNHEYSNLRIALLFLKSRGARGQKGPQKQPKTGPKKGQKQAKNTVFGARKAPSGCCTGLGPLGPSGPQKPPENRPKKGEKGAKIRPFGAPSGAGKAGPDQRGS